MVIIVLTGNGACRWPRSPVTAPSKASARGGDEPCRMTSSAPRGAPAHCRPGQAGPQFEDMAFGPNGRLQRDGIALEMNPYCRRAVAKGRARPVERRGLHGADPRPPSAEDCLREAVAWGLTTACSSPTPPLPVPTRWRQLARWRPRSVGRALRLDTHGTKLGRLGHGPGRPELAEMLGLPFLVGAKSVETDGDWLRAWCELDDGWRDAEVPLPAVVSCAERLCDPCKVDQAGRDAVDRLGCGRSARRCSARGLGEAASPTSVGEIRGLAVTRMRRITGGDPTNRCSCSSST